MGILGYYAGTDKIFIDLFGVTDPLLARLPGTPGSTVGHYYRSLPKGYDDSILSGTNMIEDTTASLLFDDLRRVTQGPLFSKVRWKAILKLNGF